MIDTPTLQQERQTIDRRMRTLACSRSRCRTRCHGITLTEDGKWTTVVDCIAVSIGHEFTSPGDEKNKRRRPSSFSLWCRYLLRGEILPQKLLCSTWPREKHQTTYNGSRSSLHHYIRRTHRAGLSFFLYSCLRHLYISYTTFQLVILTINIIRHALPNSSPKPRLAQTTVFSRPKPHDKPRQALGHDEQQAQGAHSSRDGLQPIGRTWHFVRAYTALPLFFQVGTGFSCCRVYAVEVMHERSCLDVPNSHLIISMITCWYAVAMVRVQIKVHPIADRNCQGIAKKGMPYYCGHPHSKIQTPCSTCPRIQAIQPLHLAYRKQSTSSLLRSKHTDSCLRSG